LLCFSDFVGFSHNLAFDNTISIGIATVRIDVFSQNDPPLSYSQTQSTPMNMPVEITLSGSDVDGDEISFRIVDSPDHGSLTGTIPVLTYEPDTDFSGSDSFTFVVNDGQVDSELATVTITVVGDTFYFYLPLVIK